MGQSLFDVYEGLNRMIYAIEEGPFSHSYLGPTLDTIRSILIKLHRGRISQTTGNVVPPLIALSHFLFKQCALFDLPAILPESA